MDEKLLMEEELPEIAGGTGSGKWVYIIDAHKEGYVPIHKKYTGLNSEQEAKDAMNWLRKYLTDRGYHIDRVMVFESSK